MISITNLQTGDELHLATGQRLTIEQAAGWLADDELPGARSYAISFPLSERNKKFLHYGYRPDAAVPTHDIAVRVELGNMLYRRCTFSYRISDGKGEGYLIIDSGEAYDKLKGQSLGEALPDVLTVEETTLIGVVGTLAERMNTIARAAPGSFPFTFFPLRNELMLEADLDTTAVPITRQNYINVWTKTGFKVDSGSSAAGRGYLVVPQFYLAWVMTRLFERIGYRVTGDWIGSPEVQRLVIVNLTAVSVPTGAGVSFNRGTRVTVGNHLPEMSVSDFLKAIRQRFGLIYTFNGNDKTASIRRFSDVIRTLRPLNLSAFHGRRFGIEAAQNTGYSVYDYLDENDELNKDLVTGQVIKPAPLIIGKGGTEIQLKCGTTQLIYEPSPLAPSARWFVPTVRQAGNVLDAYYAKSERYPKLQPGETIAKRPNAVGLKLLSYRGMTTDTGGNVYPLATPDVRDGQQNVIGTESCALSGRYGIWAQGLRNYFYFRDNTRKATVDALLPVATVSSLKLDQPIQLSLEQSLVSYLPGKLQAQSPGPSGLLPSKIEALTIPAGLDLSPVATTPFVWAELVITTEQVFINNTNHLLATGVRLTVNFWADRLKTTPIIATGLSINIRRGTTTVVINVSSTYEETVATYLVSGSSAILDTLVVFAEANAVGKPTLMKVTNQLDPGDGYTII